MKKILLVILLAGIGSACLKATAQMALPYVIASAGNSGPIAAGGTINFTVGEPFTIAIGTGTRLTQGFQQPNTTFDPLPIMLLNFTGNRIRHWHFSKRKTISFEK